MDIVRFKSKHLYASLTYDKKEYKLIFGHPYDMLRDKNISWEAKGYLSFIVNLSDELDFPDHIIIELIEVGYLVEVKE